MTDEAYMQFCEVSVAARVKGDFDLSISCAKQAIFSRPNEPSGYHTLAMVLAESGDRQGALSAREQAVRLLPASGGLNPDQLHYYQQCVFGLATSRLLAGDWSQETWNLWETGRLGYSWTPAQGTAYWQGQNTRGLLVICEGGYGDLFLFSRYLELLRRPDLSPPIGCLGLVVWPGCRNVRDWFALGVDTVYEVGDPIPSGVWEHSISIMSLPGIFKSRPEIGCVPEDCLHAYCGDLGDHRIGFCWRSEENQTKRRIRSLAVDDASEIASGLNAKVFSLSPCGKDLNPSATASFLHPDNLEYEPDRMRDWNATILYIISMDLVVTVDTAVAHLAGMIGVPTLCLLPVNSDWKWLTGTDRSIWYGPQLRLFRNADPLAWETGKIIDTVSEMLA